MSDWKQEILKKWGRKHKSENRLINDDLKQKLAQEVKGVILYDEPLSRYTTMRVGGKADVFIKPATLEDLVTLLKISIEHEMPRMIFGWGSNVLIRDGGIRGMVISTEDCLTKYEINNESQEGVDVLVESGVGISAFVNFCKDNSLTGCESLIGIPGSIGGAIVMNAGARGVEVADILREMTVIDEEGNLKTISREKLDFGYRKLGIPKAWTVVSGLFRLEKGDPEIIATTIREYQKKRVDTQPLNFPNVGSVFKNPEPARKGQVSPKAGQLIEDAGLKNIRVGGARVSEKHANFIINENKARARDVEVLIGLIRDKVKEQTGIVLETEVRIVGEKE